MMVRRPHVFLCFTIFGLCFLLAWRFRFFVSVTQPIHKHRAKNLQTLENIKNILQNSTSADTNLVNPTEQSKTSKTNEVKPDTQKPTQPKSTQAKPTPERPLPVLTAEPQDSFYGKGCKINRYRARHQKILNEWQKIVKRRNIEQYFICFGSFLGSVRNGDIVPYDSDMDVCMFRHDYHKLYPEESKRPVNLNDGKIHMLLQRHSPHPNSNTPRQNCKGELVRSVADDCAILDPHGRLYLGSLIYLDIFMIEDHGAQLWDEYRNRIHPRDAILPLKPCKYLGLDTLCPNNQEKYLDVYYGKDYMKPHHVCKNGSWVQNMAGARRRLV